MVGAGLRLERDAVGARIHQEDAHAVLAGGGGYQDAVGLVGPGDAELLAVEPPAAVAPRGGRGSQVNGNSPELAARQYDFQRLSKFFGRRLGQIGGEGATKDDFNRIRAFAARLCVAVPEDADNWNNYGFFARESGRYEESYQAYRRSMSLAPDNARIINDTALILEGAIPAAGLALIVQGMNGTLGAADRDRTRLERARSLIGDTDES